MSDENLNIISQSDNIEGKIVDMGYGEDGAYYIITDKREYRGYLTSLKYNFPPIEGSGDDSITWIGNEMHWNK